MRPMIRQPQGRVIPNKAGFPYPGIGFLMGNDPEDIFGTRRLSYFNTPELIGNANGLARRFAAASRTYATVTPPPGLIDFSQNFTVVVTFIIDELATARMLHYSDSTENLVLTLLSSGYLAVSWGTGSGGTAVCGSTSPLRVGVPYTVAYGRERSSGFFMYLDGAEQFRGTTSSIANNVRSTDIQIGRRSDNSSYFNGQISLFAHIAGRPDAESLSRNPWQLFLESLDEPVLDTGRVDRILAVSPASIALTGGQVGMRVSRRLRADPAVLVLAGGEASMRAGRRLAVEPAGLSIAGGDIAVRAARRLPVEPAGLSVTAGDILVRAARRLAVDGAALAIAAGHVGMRAARQLRVTPAGLDLAGGAVGLRATRRLSVAPAALVLTGGQVEMQYSPVQLPGTYTLTVSAAAITLGGGNVGMRVSRRMVVAPAALELAAGAARALVGRRLVVAPAALAMSVASVGMRAARRVHVDPAQLALVGGNVQLRYSSQVEYARAPAGAGFAPQRVSVQARPAQTGGHRPPATQENTR